MVVAGKLNTWRWMTGGGVRFAADLNTQLCHNTDYRWRKKLRNMSGFVAFVKMSQWCITW